MLFGSDEPEGGDVPTGCTCQGLALLRTGRRAGRGFQGLSETENRNRHRKDRNRRHIYRQRETLRGRRGVEIRYSRVRGSPEKLNC